MTSRDPSTRSRKKRATFTATRGTNFGAARAKAETEKAKRARENFLRQSAVGFLSTPKVDHFFLCFFFEALSPRATWAPCASCPPSPSSPSAFFFSRRPFVAAPCCLLGAVRSSSPPPPPPAAGSSAGVASGAALPRSVQARVSALPRPWGHAGHRKLRRDRRPPPRSGPSASTAACAPTTPASRERLAGTAVSELRGVRPGAAVAAGRARSRPRSRLAMTFLCFAAEAGTPRGAARLTRARATAARSFAPSARRNSAARRPACPRRR